MLRLREAKEIGFVKAKRQCSLSVEGPTPCLNDLRDERTAWMMATHEICQALNLMKCIDHGDTMTAQLVVTEFKKTPSHASSFTGYSLLGDDGEQSLPAQDSSCHDTMRATASDILAADAVHLLRAAYLPVRDTALAHISGGLPSARGQLQGRRIVREQCFCCWVESCANGGGYCVGHMSHSDYDWHGAQEADREFDAGRYQLLVCFGGCIAPASGRGRYCCTSIEMGRGCGDGKRRCWALLLY